MVKVSTLKKNPGNPRQIKGDKLDKLKASIGGFQKMMELRPMIVDENNVVIGGNMRLAAIKALGLKEIPDEWVKKALDLTPDERAQFIITDNSSFGEYDWDAIANEWSEYPLADWGLDVPGFEAVEEVGEADAEPQIDKAAELNKKWGVVSGDLWQIGEHRLLCGDSTNPLDVGNVMGGERAEIAFTSPPYNAGALEVNGNVSTQKKYDGTFDDNQTDDGFFDFLTGNLNAIIPHVDEVFYNIGLVEGNKRVINRVLFHYNDIFKDVIYWQKSTAAPHIQDGVINNKVEFILCFGDGQRKFQHAQFSQGTYWNVIEGNNASGNALSDVHKATFPMYLPENIITNFSNKTAGVMDCFAGTGTTLVACQNLNRKCYAIEISENYCAVILERMATAFPDIEIKRLDG